MGGRALALQPLDRGGKGKEASRLLVFLLSSLHPQRKRSSGRDLALFVHNLPFWRTREKGIRERDEKLGCPHVS